MINETEAAIFQTLDLIKTYIDAAIINNATAPTANKATFVELRIKNKVSIARIAVLLNVSAQTVNELESNAQRLTIQQALKLSQFYGVSADSLI